MQVSSLQVSQYASSLMRPTIWTNQIGMLVDNAYHEDFFIKRDFILHQFLFPREEGITYRFLNSHRKSKSFLLRKTKRKNIFFHFCKKNISHQTAKYWSSLKPKTKAVMWMVLRINKFSLGNVPITTWPLQDL